MTAARDISAASTISGLSLQYPMSLGVFDSYQQAQRVVDYLSDNAFERRQARVFGRAGSRALGVAQVDHVKGL